MYTSVLLVPFCTAHCGSGRGCWDGHSCGFVAGQGVFDKECGEEHCTCVSEDECVANSPAYVPCKTCGAVSDPLLKSLPESDGAAPSPPQGPLGPFSVFEFKTKAAYDACDTSKGLTSTYLPKDCGKECNADGPWTTTVVFGEPRLTVDLNGMETPVRYFGGSPTSYCQAQRAYGS